MAPLYHERVATKTRLSASVDADLIEAAEHAVERGEVPTVSAWVNDALRLKLAHEQRLRALAEYMADYEAQHGEITDDEMRLAARRAKARAVSVRPMPRPKPQRRASRR